MYRERGTTAHINTANISHNLQVFKARHPGHLIAVVKADAYGHGLARVVPALAACDAFAVATWEEAMELRALVPDKRIVLLEGVFNAYEMQAAVEHDFDVVIHQDYQIRLLKDLGPDAALDIWVKVDTGMSRLGFSRHEVMAKINEIKEFNAVHNIRIMSHFASADEAHCQQTQQQITSNQWLQSLGYEYSLSNTAAVLNGLAETSEWVRVGLGLFGISPLKQAWAKDFELRPAMHLTANVIASKHVKAGTQVGYGGHFTASKDMRIGVVGIGYADGYPWSQHHSHVLLKGVKVAVLGRVSMDMIAIDLSSFEEEMTGEEVTIWGDKLPIEAVAQDLEIIPYALTCGITKRVKFHVIQ